MKKIITLLVVFLSLVSAAQTNYYVDPVNGSNGNNGLTLDHAWKTLQKACNSAVANSIVNIKGGTYHENLYLNASGTAGHPIVYRNYLNEAVVIDGAGTTGTTMLDINGKSYMTFENLTIQNLTSVYAKGISVGSGTGVCTGITLKNITVRNIGWTENAAEIPGESDNAWAIYVHGQSNGVTNLVIDSCNVHDNILGYSEAVTVGGNVDGFTIKNCQVYDNTNIGIHTSGNTPTLEGPRNGVISANICHGNLSPIALSAGIYIDGTDNITVERNSCYENGIGIEVGCELDGAAEFVTVKNNLIYSNRNTGLAVGGYTTETTGQVLGSTFRNNTFYQNNTLNSGVGEITITKASGCVFEDNLVFSNSQNVLMALLDIEPQENNIFNYNCWFTPSGNANNIIIYKGLATYHTFNNYKNQTSFDSNSLFTNPGLVTSLLPDSAGMVLIETSNCINAGNPVLSIDADETDFDGGPRLVNGIVDIGAREFHPELGNAYPEFSNIAVYACPNPFRTRTTITFPAAVNDAVFRLYDISGKKVSEITHISGNEMALDRNGLGSGIYLYDVSQNGKSLLHGKLVTQ